MKYSIISKSNNYFKLNFESAIKLSENMKENHCINAVEELNEVKNNKN